MVTVRKKRDIQMTEGPVLGKIIRFMLPLMVTNLLQVFYNAADMMVVELSGVADAVGAVGVTSSFVTLITNIFIGFSVGANVLVARNIGAKNEEGVSRAVHTAVCMSLVFGLVGGAVGISVSKPVLTWMGTPESLLKLSSTYTYIYFAGIPFISIANYLISIFRAKGDTRTPLLVLMLSGLFNVALNLFFVLVCHLSVEGVSLATVIANAASAAVLILILRRDEGPCRFSFKKLRISKDAFREIIAIGLPAGVQGALFSISNMLIQSSILQVNDRMVAELGVPVDYEPVVKGNAATLSLENFAFTAVNAVHQAAVTFTGQNAGAKRFDRVKRVMGACYLVEGCVALLITALLVVLRNPLLSLYGVRAVAEDPVAMLAYNTAKTRIYVKWAPFILYAALDVSNAVLRGLGKSMTSTTVSLVGTCFFRVAWIYTVFRAFPILESLYISYPISWGLSAVASFICVVVILRRRIRQVQAEQIPLAEQGE
ncbi:MAG: MATE family efflux transporter [Ruminococcaceae bacterium]|nr:MATE family efflux transporter [Oscillospiraceae bacterium]